MNKKAICTVLLIILGCCLVIPEPAYSDQAIRKTRESVLAFVELEPSPSDLARIERLRKVKAKRNKDTSVINQPIRVYGVKLYVELPTVSDGPILYVGDMRIGEYRSFEEGVFFKIYNNEDLDRCYNKPIRFIYRGSKYDLGIVFPSKKETLQFRQDSEQTKQLPNLKEFLGDQVKGNLGLVE